MNAKHRRLNIIRELLQQHKVHNQAELLTLLARQNVSATQATLSRDLRSLGVLKGPDGYTLSGNHSSGGDVVALKEAVGNYLISVRQAANIAVLRTRPGHASALATEIDNAMPAGAVGSLAGDDTVFIATPSPSAAGRIVRFFTAMNESR